MTEPTQVPFDDPVEVARELAALDRPLLVGLDVDGVLAPLVAHASEARLLPGTLDLLSDLGRRTPVGVVSGRAVDDLARFGFPDVLMVAGSHGAERRGRALTQLSPEERVRLDRLRTLVERAAADAGPGAWVEPKPTGVVLHVHEADPARSVDVMHDLAETAGRIRGTDVKPGRSVVELAARRASKATAIAAMADEVEAAAVMFVGDDRTDEEVFTSLGSGDLGIHVGLSDTAATRRLRNPAAVHQLLESLLYEYATG